MIRIENLSKKFGPLAVLNGISIEIPAGECIALIGPNGCGKTTLIKSILGMVLPDSGTIRIQGHSIENQTEYRNQLGYMPQIGRYPQNMTIGQVIDLVKDIRRQPGQIDNELVNFYGLENLKNKRMGTLSGGTTQKVSAALAFLFHPQILILDEPTAGLDPLASEILKDKICREKEMGKLILITSHLLSELDGMVSRVLFMEEGRISFFYTIEELMAITGEKTISRSITHYLKKGVYEPNH